MKVVLTGGGGFLGSHVARALLRRGALVDASGKEHGLSELTIVDLKPVVADWAADPRVRQVEGDMNDRSTIEAAITDDCGSVFHFAAMLKADAAKDFRSALNFNVRALITILERCAELRARPKFFFASSIGVYANGHQTVDDSTRHSPVSSYGCHKAVGELLVEDFSRMGAIDGRGLRYPMVLTRPERGDRTVSGMMSGIVREPLLGADFVVPFAAGLRMPVTSAVNAADVTVLVHDLPAERLSQGRIVNMPSLNLSVADLVSATEAALHKRGARASLTWRLDPELMKVFEGRPQEVSNEWAAQNGLVPDADADALVAHFIRDHLE